MTDLGAVPNDDLHLRVESLGRMLLRGDVNRWVAAIGAVGPAGRAELLTSIKSPPHVELVRLVDTYGAGAVLAAVALIAPRLRRELFAAVNGSRKLPFRKVPP